MHIFYCAGGKFGEVAGMFLTEKHSQDAGPGGTGRRACVSDVLSVPGPARVKHWTPGTGRRLDPIGASGVT